MGPSRISFSARNPWVVALSGVAATIGIGIGVYAWMYREGGEVARPRVETPPQVANFAPNAADAAVDGVELSDEQEATIGVKTEPVSTVESQDIIHAYGRVAPNESQYAFITSRASGLVRSVSARIGQDVKAGELLATLDSPAVAQARLELITRMQELKIAAARAQWRQAIHNTTLELIERLKAKDAPDAIASRFSNRAVGENRERLITAYSQVRLAELVFERKQELRKTDAVAVSEFQHAQAELEAALATYQSLMDRTGYESQLENSMAQQEWRRAETAFQAARESLRVLGVDPDTDRLLEESNEELARKVNGSPGSASSEESRRDTMSRALSTVDITAPFDGTILDRELIVPGVPIDTTHRIFTLVNLSSVWIEANIHEKDFGRLTASQGGTVIFRTQAYPDLTFTGTVMYTGDQVDEKSRTVKLLARAENPDRKLKPGMWVDVQVQSRDRQPRPMIRASALLTDESHQYVFIKTSDDQFERRLVRVGGRVGDMVTVLKGLEPGQQVVVEGAFKLKSKLERGSESGS